MKADFIAAKVSRIEVLNSRTVWIELNRTIEAEPGQFVMAWLPEVGERPFSIAGMNPLSLMVVDVGSFSHAVHQLVPGDLLWIKGPLGHGYRLSGDKAILVGGGYGAAPLRPLAELARSQGMEVKVCLGARTKMDLLLCEAFEKTGCEVILRTEDGTAGERGLVTGAVEQILKKKHSCVIYACGPAGMLTAMAALAKAHDLPYQLSWEAHMRCGMGLCGSCEVPQTYDPALPVGWLACFDGPVFKSP